MDKIIFRLKRWYKFIASLFNNLIKSIMFKYGFSKSYLIKASTLLLLVAVMLSWGISNAINNDIQSATSNFSVSGTVSEVSNTYIVVTDAKGSIKSSDATYNLNIDYLKRVETDKYAPLNISDIVVGDKIIAQGVTNGYAFFIKRIVSFTSIAHDVAKVDESATASTTESTSTAPVATDTVATSTTGTSTAAGGTDISTSASTSTNSTEGGGTPTVTPPVADVSTSTSTSTPDNSDSKEGTSTDVSTPDAATSTDNSSSSPTVIDSVNNVIQDVIEKVKDVVSDVIDSVAGGSSEEVVTPSETPANPAPTPAPVVE
jgi:hypothetical protein